MLEKETQAAILEYLALRKIFAWRNNSGAAKMMRKDGSQGFIRFGAIGSPDILAILPPTGRLLAVECKSPTGRISPQQEAFGERIKAAGGVYVMARSIDDIIAVLDHSPTGKVA